MIIGVKMSNKNTVDYVQTSVITEIPIKTIDNMSYINVSINGNKSTFIIDTGCSDMNISNKDLKQFLNKVIIKKSDFLGNVTCYNADGLNYNCSSYNIRNVTIGYKTLHNIKCIVSNYNSSPKLLGTSVLKQLGNIKINYKNNTIAF